MPTMTTPTPPASANPAVTRLFEAVRVIVSRADAFGSVELKAAGANAETHPSMLAAAAKNAAEPAEYRLFEDGGKLWVALVTADRWLSQSIEAGLVNNGDKLEELLEEELFEVGYEAGTLPFEHFRSTDKLYTFRSPLPVNVDEADAAAVAAKCLLAYEACFRRLGDMDSSGEDE